MQKQLNINMLERVGSFAENKDTAKIIRKDCILPILEKGNDIILDFTGVGNTTQSFIHALISQVIRTYKIDILDRITFKGCNEKVRNIVSIVTDYMQYEE